MSTNRRLSFFLCGVLLCLFHVKDAIFIWLTRNLAAQFSVVCDDGGGVIVVVVLFYFYGHK